MGLRKRVRGATTMTSTKMKLYGPENNKIID
jgi:hypothetical protein